MFGWLKRKNIPERKAESDHGALPGYAAIRATPTMGLPPEVAEEEASAAFAARLAERVASLREPPLRPRADKPLFVELLAGASGLVTIEIPGREARGVVVFSTPLRAADYARAALPQGTAIQFLSTSPQQLVAMLRDLRSSGVELLVLDRCPRCEIFTAIASASIVDGDRAIRCWSVWKATERLRLDLYLGHARSAASAARFDVARDLAFETIAHVSMEDPRAHFLLGEIAVATRDEALLSEARAFLQFLHGGSWERALDEVVRSGAPDFQSPWDFRTSED